MKSIAWLTPLPPVRSGIAGYSAMLLPEVAKHARVTAVVGQEAWEDPGVPVIRDREFDPAAFDVVICQLGNNPHHEFVYRRALATPSIVVLHDLVLHHLIVEMTLARGDREAYVETMRRNHGDAGAAWAAARAAGFHTELANFLMPASIEIAQKARGVVVHNRYAAETLVSFGVTTPISVVEHPYVPPPATNRAATRALVTPASSRPPDGTDSLTLIGMFGFVTAAKRPEVVMDAFARALRERPDLRLIIVGEPAPNVDLEALAQQFGVPPGTWRALGFVSDEEFTTYLDAVDRVVNLRYPSAGETSGALVHILGAGKPVAVSDYAQFADYPREIVTRIPFDDEVATLEAFMTAADADSARSARQQAWLTERASLDAVARQYLDAIGRTGGADYRSVPAALPLFPRLALERFDVVRDGARWSVSVDVRNDGEALTSWRFGEPEYRLLAKAYDGATEIADAWLRLPGDLEAGASAVVDFAFTSQSPRVTLRLFHAIEGLPHFEMPPFAATELA